MLIKKMYVAARLRFLGLQNYENILTKTNFFGK